MKTLLPPKAVAESLFNDKLKNAAIREMFQSRKREEKISLLLVKLIGPETERYAAEPVYAVSGKGHLKSKGIEGLREEVELEEFLRGSDGQTYVDRVLRLVDRKILSS